MFSWLSSIQGKCLQIMTFSQAVISFFLRQYNKNVQAITPASHKSADQATVTILSNTGEKSPLPLNNKLQMLKNWSKLFANTYQAKNYILSTDGTHPEVNKTTSKTWTSWDFVKKQETETAFRIKFWSRSARFPSKSDSKLQMKYKQDLVLVFNMRVESPFLSLGKKWKNGVLEYVNDVNVLVGRWDSQKEGALLISFFWWPLIGSKGMT